MVTRKELKGAINVSLILLLLYTSFTAINSVLALIVLELICLFYFLYRNDESTYIYFLLCTILQNFILLIAANNMSATESNIIIILKELIVYISAVVYFIRIKRGKINTIDVCFLAFCVFAALSVLVNRSSLTAVIASLRQFMIPFLCYYFGRLLNIKNKSKIMRCIVVVSTVIALLGLLIYFFADENFWLGMGFERYWYNKTGDGTFSFANFYTWDFGVRIKRLVSIFVDPLAATHFLMLGFLTLVYMFPKSNANYAIKTILFISLVLCFSKATIVLIAVVVFMKQYMKSNSRINKFFYKILITVLAVLAFIVLYRYSGNLDSATSTGNHFNSLLNGLTNLSLFGGGLGISGYNAKIYSNIVSTGEVEVGESFFATLTSQMGILGAVALYSFIILVIIDNYRKFKKYNQPINYLAMVLLITVAVESFVSASSVSMLGTGLYFILTGIASNVNDKRV